MVQVSPKSKTVTKPSKMNSRIFKYRPPKIALDENLIPCPIPGVNDILGGGFAPGSLVSLIGIPKTGKTTFLINTAIMYAKQGKDVLLVFNESTRETYLAQINMYARGSGSVEKLTEHLYLFDADRMVVKSANFDSIDKFVQQSIMAPIINWLKNHPNAVMVGFDSVSKFINQYPAQAFELVKEISHGFQEYGESLKTNEINYFVLAVMQKADYSKQGSKVAFGGLRITHEGDGALYFSRERLSSFRAKSLGMTEDEVVYVIEGEFRNMKAIDGPSLMIMDKSTGRIRVGARLEDIIYEKTQQE